MVDDDGSALGVILDPCVGAAVTTNTSGTSIEKVSAFTVAFFNDATPALTVFQQLTMKKLENIFMSELMRKPMI